MDGETLPGWYARMHNMLTVTRVWFVYASPLNKESLANSIKYQTQCKFNLLIGHAISFNYNG